MTPTHADPLSPRRRALAWAEGLLLAGFCFYLFTMPLGITFEEIGAIAALAGLAGVCLLDWRGCALRRLPLWWLFALFYGLLAFKTVHSISPAHSWYAVRHCLHKGLVMPFIALEVGRRPRWLALAVASLAAMSCVQGLDGLWQYATGHDAFRGLPVLGGRLTGSFATYRVGDLLGMTLAPCLALPWLLPDRWPATRRWAVAAAILAPGVFLWIMAQSRSGYVALSVAALGFFYLHCGLTWVNLGAPLAAGGLLVAFGPRRVGLEKILSDGRVQELWPLAVEVFRHWPLLGSGINTYNPAFKRLGYSLQHPGHPPTIMHPHNLYLQFLAETGLLGLGLFLAFLFVPLVWAGRRIRRGLATGRRHWRLAAACWAGFLGYPFMAIGSSQEFLRSWWLGIAMALLGLALGACLAEDDGNPATPALPFPQNTKSS